MSSSNFTYRDAGVDLELNQEAMKRLPPLMKRTHSSRVMELTGGFAGLFQLNGESNGEKKQYRDPVMVSGTDGVGTKLKVAIKAEQFKTVGIDLVAMCVNDCLCLGAEPLFFLDYIALNKDDPELLASLVEGVSEGCLQSGAALLGGETAIMPDLYAPGDFDMAGFCVGVAERDQLIEGPKRIQPGDVLIGLPSSGFHSNGFSLIRKVIFEGSGLSVDDQIKELDQTVQQAILEPTKIYAREVKAVTEGESNSSIHGIAHITGGGLPENLERLLPDGCQIQIDCKSWPEPELYRWFQSLGQVDPEEMFRVFNMGIGLVLIVPEEAASQVTEKLSESGTDSWMMGKVIEGEKSVILNNLT